MIIAFLIVKTIGKSPTLQAGMDENNNPDCRCSKKKLLLTFAASGQICIVKSETSFRHKNWFLLTVDSQKIILQQRLVTCCNMAMVANSKLTQVRKLRILLLRRNL